MEEQRSTIDETFGQPAEPSAGEAVSNAAVESAPGSVAPSTARVEGKGPTMNHEHSAEAPAASLVGSLEAFSLADILSMLASTKQTGELQVVSDTMDGKVWLADGEFSNAQVGAAATIGQAVFELACVSDGWFYFTVGVASSSGQPTVPVVAVLNEVRPQVDEWREIRHDVPLEAVVTLAADPPSEDVQIRSDQWRVLTTVGSSGHSVRTVLEQIGGDQIVGLRTLRDLHTAGLIELDHSRSSRPDPDTGVSFTPSDRGPDLTALPAPPDRAYTGVDDLELLSAAPPPPDVADPGDTHPEGLAEVAVMPPPIADDPWTPNLDTSGISDNGVA